MASRLEFYETLKRHMDEEAARVIAEAVPLSEQLATKADVDTLRHEIRQEIGGLRNEIGQEIGGLRQEIGDVRHEIDGVRHEIDGLRRDIVGVGHEFKGELHRVEAAIYRWMLTFFATLWLGMAGIIVAIVLKG